MSDADAMLQAAKDGDSAAVAELLQRDPALASTTGDLGKSALHWAAEGDHVAFAELLLDAGAAIEARTSWGATPFAWAAHLGSLQVAELLLSRGARGMNLFAAAGLGKLDLVREFLGRPESMQPVAPDDHWPPDSARVRGDFVSHAFWSACRNGHTAVAEFLLQQGAEINAKGIFGGTALHWAAIQGHRHTVEFLLARGADPALRDAKFNALAADWAVEGRHEAIREMLAH